MSLLRIRLAKRNQAPGGEHGQTLVEYALIIAFIAIFLVLALQLLADGIDTTFTTVVNVLADAVGALGG